MSNLFVVLSKIYKITNNFKVYLIRRDLPSMKRLTAIKNDLVYKLSNILSIIFKISLPEIPFMDRVGIVFILCFLLSVALTIFGKKEDHPNAIDLKGISFHTSLGYTISGIGILFILITLYSIWW